MAVQSAYTPQYTALTTAVRRWERRRRAGLTWRWLPRALTAGLGVGVLAGIIGRLRPFLLPNELLLLAGIAVGIALIACVGIAWLYERADIVRAARRFDLLFDLGERLSTALELIDGRIQTGDELAGRQIADAAAVVSSVDPRGRLPFSVRGRDWVIAGLLAGVLALLIALPNPQNDAIVRNADAQTAFDAAAETMRDITQEVAADPNLSAAERESLLQALETALNALERSNISPEEAFAAASAVESQLRERADAANAAAQNQRAALESASAALREQSGASGEGGTGESGALSEQLGQMAQREGATGDAGMSASERADAAQALQQAAQAMQPIDPNAARSMQQAAQAMAQSAQTGQAGQPQTQQALQNAQQAAQNAENAAQNAQNANQQLSQQAQQAADAAREVGEQSQSGQPQDGSQSQQPQNQAGQPSQPAQQGQQPQAGQPSQSGQPSQAGQPSEQGQAGQPSEQGQAGQPSESGQSQSGSQSAQQEGGQSGQASAPSGQGQAGEASDGSQSAAAQGQAGSSSDDLQSTSRSSSAQGAGDSAGDAGQDSASQRASGASGSIDAQNNPDGVGQRGFDPVYAPRRIGGQPGATTMQLETNPDGIPLTQGEYAQNPAGDALVPYNEVFTEYDNTARRALDSGYVPLGLRDVVRDYFTSLEPDQR
ncbi:MAG: hypothetical protein SGI73_21315 [Chloroflexota bacterium]|nr:hypothetical protein [Chloroflexota bacterium]